MNEIVGYDVMPLNLRGADLSGANLDDADLIKADCQGCDFTGASLKGAELNRAELSKSTFTDADLSGAKLRAADLSESVFLRTNVEGADFGYSGVHGISCWDLIGTPADETNLLVTPTLRGLRTDGLALAQLINFLSRHEHAGKMIDAVANKVVLLLGNFEKERKAVLDAVGGALRSTGYIPVIFDFEGPAAKDTTGTVETLARLSNFIIADLTDPSSVPHELAITVPLLRTTPVVLLRMTGSTGYSMVSNLEAYPWVMKVHEYSTSDLLIEQVPEIVRKATGLADSLRSESAG